MRVAVEGDDGERVLSVLLDADRRAAVTLVLEPRWSARERAAVLDAARPDMIVGDTGEGSPHRWPAARGDVPFLLVTTSGSTGTPTVLQRSRASWLRSFAAFGAAPGPVLIAGPLSSSLFLFGALHALWSGAELRLRSRFDAAEALTAASVHVVPAMLTDLVAAAERAPAALRTVVCGGAHVGDGLRERFARALPGVELVEYYGSAEHSVIAIRRDGALRPVPGVDLDVRDGELWVRSPLAADGHLHAGVLVPAAEWTTVGDRVTLLRDDGGDALVVHGRGPAMISSGGALVAAEEVETVLREVAGVGEVVVAGSPHPRLGAVVTAIVDGEPALAALRAAARAGLAPAKRPRRWLRITDLPRTASGKPARGQIAAALADGSLDATPLR